MSTTSRESSLDLENMLGLLLEGKGKSSPTLNTPCQKGLAVGSSLHGNDGHNYSGRVCNDGTVKREKLRGPLWREALQTWVFSVR